MTKISRLIPLIAFCTAVTTGFAEKKNTITVKADSLNALRCIIRAEMKQENRVLITERRLSDSLMCGVGRTPRSDFDKLIDDSAVTHEVKSEQEFRRYWTKVEKRDGIKALKDQYAREDIDKTLIPKTYLFDSTVVIYPGWIILRKK